MKNKRKNFSYGLANDQIFCQSSYSKPKRPHYCRTGSWNSFQNLRYAQFLQMNRDLFKDQKNRRSSCIFKKLSKHIKYRSALQCSSHHQKMMAKYQSIQKIMERLFQLAKIDQINQKNNNFDDRQKEQMVNKNKQRHPTSVPNHDQPLFKSSWKNNSQLFIEIQVCFIEAW